MNQQEIDESKAICEAATPGPWYSEPYTERADGIWHGDGMACIGLAYYGVEQKTPQANGIFIAHARTALPKALDEIEKLKGLLKRLEHCFAGICCPMCYEHEDDPHMEDCELAEAIHQE